jgi:hypothetical protein
MLRAIDDIDGRSLFRFRSAAAGAFVHAMLDRATVHSERGFLDLCLDQFHVRGFVGMDTAA